MVVGAELSSGLWGKRSASEAGISALDSSGVVGGSDGVGGGRVATATGLTARLNLLIS